MGRIAGILSLEVEDKNSQLDAIQRIGSELAMHVVAAKPLFLTKELVSSDALESEREILKSQVLGNLHVFYNSCLLASNMKQTVISKTRLNTPNTCLIQY